MKRERHGRNVRRRSERWRHGSLGVALLILGAYGLIDMAQDAPLILDAAQAGIPTRVTVFAAVGWTLVLVFPLSLLAVGMAGLYFALGGNRQQKASPDDS